MRAARKVTLVFLVTVWLRAASGHWDSTENITPDPAPSAPVSATEQARDLLERARAYQMVKAYDDAQKEIISALAKASNDLRLREEATRLWLEVEKAKQSHTETASPGQKRKFLAELDEAGRLASEGKTAEAAAKASQVLSATNDPDVVAKAEAVLSGNHPSLGGLWNAACRDFFAALKWVLTALGAVLLVAILYVLLRLARRLFTRPRGGKKTVWRLGVIADKTETNAADFVIAGFERWRGEQPAPSSGLLRLGTLRLPTVARFEQTERPDFDLSAALEGLQLQIGTVNVSAVAKVFVALRNWTRALKPSITGTAFTQGSQIVVHLVRRSANGTSAPVVVAGDAAGLQKAAEAATYKMYYLIAKQTTVNEAELANKLREGLEELSQYVSGRDPKQLQTAYATFRAVVQEKPTHEQASLYEAVALDLLERHDEAISRFTYLANNADDPDLRTKAKYNEAVSLFRKYRPEALEIAIAKLDEIIGVPTPEALLPDPVKALAYAAKANAIAHKFIFWQTIIYSDATKVPADIQTRKEESRGQIANWEIEINAILAALEQVHGEVKRRLKPKPEESVKDWEPLTLRQLEWAIQNAKGNAHLNLAKYFYSQPDSTSRSPEIRDDNLHKALSAFQQCELLLPAGVETLTNLATTLLYLRERQESRRYAELAIELNPNYEYAYYRLAEAWIDENRRDEAIKVLGRFPKAPQISGFKEFFNRYYIEPKSA
jgi:hypothetical protein